MKVEVRKYDTAREAREGNIEKGELVGTASSFQDLSALEQSEGGYFAYFVPETGEKKTYGQVMASWGEPEWVGRILGDP